MRIKETLALFAGLTLLTGCGSFVAPTNPANVATDIQALASDAQVIGSGLSSVLPSLCTATPGQNPFLPTAKCTALSADFNLINADAAKLTGFSNIADATSTAQELTTAVQDILTTAAQFPLPTAISLAVKAAAVLLPVIEQEAGLPLPAAAAAAPTMSPAAARAVLHAAALGQLK